MAGTGATAIGLLRLRRRSAETVRRLAILHTAPEFAFGARPTARLDDTDLKRLVEACAPPSRRRTECGTQADPLSVARLPAACGAGSQRPGGALRNSPYGSSQALPC